jgi:hypothetical protein
LTRPASGSTLPTVALDEAALNPGTAAGAIDVDDDGGSPLYCYRHPKSETYVRCGRCDQPICPKCAVQGPVGFRCRQCGLVKNATLSSFTPRQLLLGFGTSVAGGAILGFLGGQIGIFGIIVAFFGGGLVAEAAVRFTGLKRGPIMRLLVYGGILAGFALGTAIELAWFLNTFPIEGEEIPVFEIWLQSMLPTILIGAGAAFAGAYSRVRWF